METDALIRSNMDYVNNFQTLHVNTESLDKRGKILHFMNLTTIEEKMKKHGKLEKAMLFYKESKTVLELFDDSTQGKKEQMRKFAETISLLTRQLAQE